MVRLGPCSPLACAPLFSSFCSVFLVDLNRVELMCPPTLFPDVFSVCLVSCANSTLLVLPLADIDALPPICLIFWYIWPRRTRPSTPFPTLDMLRMLLVRFSLAAFLAPELWNFLSNFFCSTFSPRPTPAASIVPTSS